MGLQDGKCDSCGAQLSYLFPIVFLTELVSGGEAHIMQYLCRKCYEAAAEEAEAEVEESETEEPDEEDDEEDDEDDSTICECCLKEKVSKEDDYCYGCGHIICVPCDQRLESTGKHTLNDHKTACRKADAHP
jgi:hypothetical protein